MSVSYTHLDVYKRQNDNKDLKHIFAEIAFDENTSLNAPQMIIQSNIASKERVISQIIQIFKHKGIATIPADNDADLLIIQTALKNRVITKM